MKFNASLIWNWIALAISAGSLLWVLYRWLKKSDEPAALITRWIVSVVLGGLVVWNALAAKDEFSKIFAVLTGAACGLVYAILWGPSFCGWVAKQFTGLYDGGDVQIEPRAMYSMAEAKRKQGKYAEAMAEVRSQLERFPEDFAGWVLQAEIQAENLNDLTAACETIDRIIGQETHHPKNVAYALNRLADWHLKFGQDREAAKSALERVIQLLPDTEQAQLARQRIAHLTPDNMLLESHEPRRFHLRHHEENLGLREDASKSEALATDDPASLAGALVKHLEQHPQDYEAREKLALIYADHYQRLELASDQLEQLISIPYQPAKQVVHWLNLLADIQIRLTGDAKLARSTLQRIGDRFPKTAAAENASTRMAYLNLELRSKQTSQAVKLGLYEQNLGLKEKKPNEDSGQSASRSR